MRSQLCLLCFACCWLTFGQETCAAADPPARKDPPVVEVCKPVEREVTDDVDFAGKTRSVAFVEIRTRVTGFVNKVNFKDGSAVKQGDVLFEIDPRLYQAELERAEANAAVREARMQVAVSDLQRGKANLAKNPGALSAEDIEKFAAVRAEAEAELRAARASLAIAKVNLDFTRITAPIEGRISQRFVDPGGLARGDETILATIASQDPICVSFDLDERTALKLRRSMKDGTLKSDAPGMPVQMELADETGFPHKGTLEYIDSSADFDKGTVRARAIFPNSDGLMIPGLYAQVRMQIKYRALHIPDNACDFGGHSVSVLVVNDKNVVELRRLAVGPKQDEYRAIAKGLQPDDWVIISDREGLKPGITVKPRKVTIPQDKPK